MPNVGQTYAEALAEKDKDADGQIGIGEWDHEMMKRTWFIWDLNGDEKLDEREYVYLQSAQTAKGGLFAIDLDVEGKPLKGDVTETHLAWQFDGRRGLSDVVSPVLVGGLRQEDLAGGPPGERQGGPDDHDGPQLAVGFHRVDAHTLVTVANVELGALTGDLGEPLERRVREVAQGQLPHRRGGQAQQPRAERVPGRAGLQQEAVLLQSPDEPVGGRPRQAGDAGDVGVRTGAGFHRVQDVDGAIERSHGRLGGLTSQFSGLARAEVMQLLPIAGSQREADVLVAHVGRIRTHLLSSRLCSK